MTKYGILLACFLFVAVLSIDHTRAITPIPDTKAKDPIFRPIEDHAVELRRLEGHMSQLGKLDDATLIVRASPPPQNADGPKKGARPELVHCTATAVEKDGKVLIQLKVPKLIPYTVMRLVRGAYVDADGKTFENDGPGRRFEGGAIIETPDKKLVQVSRTLTENHVKQFMISKILVADGKKIQVSRKDGTILDPRQLPVLLKKESPVVFIQWEP